MSAQPNPLPTREPTYAQLKAQMAVLQAAHGELRKQADRQQERSDALIDTMRLTLREVDQACGATVGADNRLATMMLTRRMFLNAIQAWKE